MKAKCDNCGYIINMPKKWLDKNSCPKCKGDWKKIEEIRFPEIHTSKLRKVVLSTITIFILTTLIFGSFFVVQAGEQALVFNSINGLKSQVYGEGMHLKYPILDKVIKMNIRVQKQTELATSASRDLQDVKTEVAVNFQIDKTQIVDIYRRIGQSSTNQDYMQENIMNPIILETVKGITAKYTAEELITKRPIVKAEIDKAITERMKTYNLIVTDVSITNFEFSETFTKAIEEKVTAEQNALKEQRLALKTIGAFLQVILYMMGILALGVYILRG